MYEKQGADGVWMNAGPFTPSLSWENRDAQIRSGATMTNDPFWAEVNTRTQLETDRLRRENHEMEMARLRSPGYRYTPPAVNVVDSEDYEDDDDSPDDAEWTPGQIVLAAVVLATMFLTPLLFLVVR